ncbi:MAG: hypothetical protein mread185_000040 [Mycoplasmataceae bacterium]|nr:MAG: hypothetical protein mread185_000040 [Mycoplasmataceae bacterium]
MSKLTLTEQQYLKMFDRRDIRIRIPFQEKGPHILNWTKYYSETLSISQMLEQGFNYGIRTGKKVGNYYHVVLDLDDIWAKERIKDARFVETNKGIHRYLLIKELPKNCWLVNEEGKKVGELHSKGRQIVGIGSIHPTGKRYSLRGRINVKFCLKFESLSELQNYLDQRKIFTSNWGKLGKENINSLNLFTS